MDERYKEEQRERVKRKEEGEREKEKERERRGRGEREERVFPHLSEKLEEIVDISGPHGLCYVSLVL